ncbi:MAG TPA: hypothetical protein VFR43_03355, partial [Gaiellaceae bacterium]|nr:hypothetical protein [Gaiellaceae bacterium]
MSTEAAERNTQFAANSPRFADVVGPEPRLERLVDVDAHEGPAYVQAEDALYFTTVRAGSVSLKRLACATATVTVVLPDANNANGMTLDREGRLVICEQGSRTTPARISRLDLVTGLR